MARRTTSTSHSRRSRNSGRSSSSSSRFIYIAIGLAVIAVLGLAVWLLTRTTGYQFKRADLDKYVEITQKPNILNDGASVYVDMSDGMNYAYATPQSQALLQSVINKLA